MRLVTTTPRIAIPSTDPVCWAAFTDDDAIPTCWFETELMTTAVSGEMHKPSPAPISTMYHQKDPYDDVTVTVENKNMPTAAVAMPVATSGRAPMTPERRPANGPAAATAAVIGTQRTPAWRGV
jgi:hypothetical protein